MTPRDILVAARARIKDPKNWTTCASARDSSGYPTRADSCQAVQWCAVGAVLAVAGDTGLSTKAHLALHEVSGGPATLNDRDGHAAVLRMYDRAIEYLDERPGA